MNLREKQQFDAYKPVVMPSYDERKGRWISRPMSSAEGSQWLKDMLSAAQGQEGKLSSHSLKVTLLTWMNMFGALDQQQQRVTGHHLDPGASSALTYSREAMATVLTKTAVMLSQARLGVFNPDATIAERISAGLTQLLSEVEAHDSEWKTHAEEQDFSSSESEAAGEDEEARNDDEITASCEMARHLVSGVLHIVTEEQGHELLCGRRLGPSYGHVEADVRFDGQVCRQCSKSYAICQQQRPAS